MMNTLSGRRMMAAAGASAVCAMLALGGCLVSSQSNEKLTGTYVAENTFGQIQTGVTTRAWVVGTLGEPTQKTPQEDGGELWKWAYSKVRQSSGAILFVFGGSSTKETGGAAFVEFGRDGVVRKAWRAD